MYLPTHIVINTTIFFHHFSISFTYLVGWEEHYGERSFLWQCRHRFGDDVGFKIWNTINDAFDRMPLAAVIDQDIFCVHGGIPRPVTAHEDGTYGSRVQDIMNVPRIAGINPPLEFEDERHQQVASDCIWSDPASEEQEMKSVDPDSGYGESLRGGGAICFGHKAVKDFLAQHGFSYIMVRCLTECNMYDGFFFFDSLNLPHHSSITVVFVCSTACS
jgi:hypothetical protein